MKELKLAFGGCIYLEEYGGCKQFCVPILDSDKKRFDYFTVESLQETADFENISIENLLALYAEEMSKQETIEDLLDYLGLEKDVYTDKAEAELTLGLNFDKASQCGMVNRIGKYYLYEI